MTIVFLCKHIILQTHNINTQVGSSALHYELFRYYVQTKWRIINNKKGKLNTNGIRLDVTVSSQPQAHSYPSRKFMNKIANAILANNTFRYKQCQIA
jgi:hypothetical protein